MTDSTLTWNMPQLGNGVDSAVVQEWMIGVGEPVAEGDPIVVIETDKATSELEAPTSGTLLAVHAQEGAEIAVGEPLADIRRT